MKIRGLLAMALFLGSSAFPALAQSRTVNLGMPYLECFKTTEAGEDEVYVIVAGRWANGETFRYRVPGPSAHWDLNDGEGDPPVLNQTLLRIDMAEGSAVDLVILVMEEDGGSSGQWTELAAGAVGFLDSGVGSLIDAIGSALNIHDSDDFIGAISVHVELHNGTPYATFVPRERVSSGWDTSTYWTRRPVQMNGDGSSYVATFSIE